MYGETGRAAVLLESSLTRSVDLGFPDSLNINSSPKEVSGYQDALLELLELLIPANAEKSTEMSKRVLLKQLLRMCELKIVKYRCTPYTQYTWPLRFTAQCPRSHSSSFLSFHDTCFAPTQLPISSFRIWLTLSLAIRSSCWRPEWIAIEGKLHSTSLAQARSQGPIATNRTRSSTNSTNGS